VANRMSCDKEQPIKVVGYISFFCKYQSNGGKVDLVQGYPELYKQCFYTELKKTTP